MRPFYYDCIMIQGVKEDKEEKKQETTEKYVQTTEKYVRPCWIKFILPGI